MSYFIARPINGISINGNEYVMDDSGHPMEFPSRQAALKLLLDHGYTLEDVEAEGILFELRNSAEDKYIILDTFPESADTTAIRFVVEKDWLLPILESLDSFHLRKGVDLNNFLDNYDYSETDLIRDLATRQGKILHEEVVVDG